MHMRILSRQLGAMSCISQALPASCNLNPQCICSDAAFISTISCCVSTACDVSGQQAALGYAKQICAPVGVTNLVSFVRTTVFPRPCSDSSPAHSSLLRRNCCIVRHQRRLRCNRKWQLCLLCSLLSISNPLFARFVRQPDLILGI